MVEAKAIRAALQRMVPVGARPAAAAVRPLPARAVDWLAPRNCWGVALSREQVTAVAAERAGDRWHARTQHAERLARPLFRGRPDAALRADLAAALTRALPGAAGLSAPVQLALPDAATALRVLELDQWPDGQRARADLVRWRCAQELRAEPAAIATTWQHLGEDGGRQLVLAVAVDADWLACVDGAAEDAGIALSCVDMGLCYRLMRLSSNLALDAGGALVTLEPGVWSLAIVDEHGRLRYARGRWRDEATGLDAIADEVERSVLGYVQGHSGRRIGELWITGVPGDCAAMKAVLDERTHSACRILPWDAGYIDMSAVDDGYWGGALDAAVCR